MNAEAALNPFRKSGRQQRRASISNHPIFQYTPQHLVRLLQIIVDSNCDLAVRQVASIHFKNFVAKNWSPNEPDEPQKISASDKERPVPLEGQPTDPELRKSWVWWKVKSGLIQILNRVVYSEHKSFCTNVSERIMLEKFLNAILRLLNAIRSGDYMPDRIINLVLQYLNWQDPELPNVLIPSLHYVLLVVKQKNLDDLRPHAFPQLLDGCCFLACLNASEADDGDDSLGALSVLLPTSHKMRFLNLCFDFLIFMSRLSPHYYLSCERC
ncbi:hypothetical protein HPP92_013664 [Vanilla planifolia]|uniref:Importin N-terminal domain-containing protein n=1 Tax=Vanilla planifolia TaxID=51239 RepID=A0A835QYP2_VANPL|nr:hypothetical protein HPP92_013664 [Vanilla planifolia]